MRPDGAAVKCAWLALEVALNKVPCSAAGASALLRCVRIGALPYGSISLEEPLAISLSLHGHGVCQFAVPKPDENTERQFFWACLRAAMSASRIRAEMIQNEAGVSMTPQPW